MPLGIGIGLSPLVRNGLLLNYEKYIKSLFGSALTAYWPLQEKSGTTAVDVIGGLNATYTGVTVGEPGISSAEKSAKLNINTSNIKVINAGLNAAFSKSEGSISIWFKVNEAFWVSAAASDLFNLYINETNYIKVGKITANSLSVYYASNQAVRYQTIYYQNNTNWMNITATWSVSNNSFALYINGIKYYSLTGAQALTGTLYQNTQVFGNDLTSKAWIGNLSHVFWLNKYVTAAEAYSIFRYKTAFLVAEGDSRTATYMYPTYATNALTNKLFAYWNNAVSGGTIADMAARGTAVDAMFKTGNNNIILVFCGVNNSLLTAQQMYDDLKAYCLARRAAGYKVIICTEIDCQNAYVLSNGWATKYLDLNTKIRNDHSFADALADFGADPRLQDASNTTYFNADKVHPTDAGARVLGEIASPCINALS